MATGNFVTMENFELYAAHTPYCKICPECGCFMSSDAEKCDDCGTSLEDAKEVYDEASDQFQYEHVTDAMKKLNKGYTFHELTVKSGHYSGSQFYVEEKFHGYKSLEDINNEDANYYYGMCRSKLLRKYNAEVRRVRKDMEELAKDNGYEKYYLTARFSNGECIYTKAEAFRNKDKKEAKAA